MALPSHPGPSPFVPSHPASLHSACTVGTTVIQPCIALQPGPPATSGCFQTASGIPLAYDAQPYWVASTAQCLDRGNPAPACCCLPACFPASVCNPHLPLCPPPLPAAAKCDCADQAPGDRVLHRYVCYGVRRALSRRLQLDQHCVRDIGIRRRGGPCPMPICSRSLTARPQGVPALLLHPLLDL